MFWGVTIHPDRKYSQVVEMNYHISMATLEIDLSKPNETKRVQLMLEQEKSTYLLCNLDTEHNQVPLDLIFSEGENVCFYLNGDGVVHLTGYIVDNLSDTDSDILEPDLVENIASKRQNATDMTKNKLAGDDDLDEEDSDDEDVFENDLDDELDEEDIDEEDDEEDDDDEMDEEPKSTPKRPMVQNGQGKVLTEPKSEPKGIQEQKSKMGQQPQGIQQNKFGNQNSGRKFPNQKFGGQNNSNQFNNHNNKRKGFTPSGGNKGNNKFNKNKKGRFSMN